MSAASARGLVSDSEHDSGSARSWRPWQQTSGWSVAGVRGSGQLWMRQLRLCVPFELESGCGSGANSLVSVLYEQELIPRPDMVNSRGLISRAGGILKPSSRTLHDHLASPRCQPADPILQANIDPAQKALVGRRRGFRRDLFAGRSGGRGFERLFRSGRG